MNSRLLITILTVFICVCNTAIAQSFKVDISFENYESDTIIIGYYYANRQLVKDTVYAEQPNKFSWKGTDPLHAGTYLLLTTPDKNFIQFFVNEPYPKYDIKFEDEQLKILAFDGSEDNKRFNEYIDFLNDKRPKAERLRQSIENSNDRKRVSLQQELDNIDKAVAEKQQFYVDTYPDSFTGKTIKASMNIDYPDPPPGLSDKELEYYKFEKYRKHYFDNTDLSDSTLIYTPFLYNRVDYFINKLTIQRPDSINASIDHVLNQMHPESQMYRYFLSHFYNTYVKSKIVGMDAVTVHLVDNYYSVNKAPWTDPELLIKMEDNARKLRPTLIGNTAKDIQVETEDGTPFKLSDLNSEYLVLLFWAPDCGHCKKAMPHVIEFEKEYRDKNVKLVAICTKYQDKVPGCWEAVKEKGMESFINAVDPYGKSRFKSWYDVRTTPKIFILDKDLKIILKGIGAEQLSDVMSEIMAEN